MKAELAIVGGGPAGLAMAIHAARKGIDVVVLERRRPPLDKACGEGLMPSGVRALERMGVLALIDPSERSPFAGIRYVQEDGTAMHGRLPGPGLGIRRTALAEALAARASALGARLLFRCRVESFQPRDDGLLVETEHGPIDCRLLVAADGGRSRIRSLAGLDGWVEGPRRYGLRQHFGRPPWSDSVEVHLSPTAEAYVTPVGPSRVGVAFLFEPERIDGPISVDALLRRFPSLAASLAGAPRESTARGAGPLRQAPRGVVSGRLALLGDAAGYVDALSGEGLSLAFAAAEALAAVLDRALADPRGTLEEYERIHHALFRRYALTTEALLGIVRRPRLRRAVVRLLAGRSVAFDAMLRWALGPD